MLNYWNDTDLSNTVSFMDDLRRRMDRVFGEFDPRAPGDQVFEPESWSVGRAGWPRVVLRDEGTRFDLVALFPGVLEKDLRVSLHDDLLTISASRSVQAPEGYRTHRRERAPFELSRTFTLPAKVDPDKTSAELKDGVLTVKLEKAAEARPRQIAVKAS